MMTKLSFAAVLAAATFTTAGANADHRLGDAYQLAHQLHGQSQLLGVQAEQLLADCHGYRTIAIRLEDLCRDLDRLERAMNDGVYSRHDARRLGRQAERVDQEVCDLQEAVCRVIDRELRVGQPRQVQYRRDLRPDRGDFFASQRRPSGLVLHIGRGKPRVSFYGSRSPLFAGHTAIPRAPAYIPRGGPDRIERTAYREQVRFERRAAQLESLRCLADDMRLVSKRLARELCF